MPKAKSDVTVAASPKKNIRKSPKKATSNPKTSSKKTPAAKKESAESDLKRTEETAGDLTKTVRWTKLKQLIISTMQSMGATKVASAATAEEIVKASNGALNDRQVTSQCKAQYDLVVFGYVKQHKTEGSGMTYSLTAKGKNLKF